jgi:xanthine dehydrogenase YagR molybdenum-binding subunit
MDAGNRPGPGSACASAPARRQRSRRFRCQATAPPASALGAGVGNVAQACTPAPISRAPSTTCSSMPGRAARCAAGQYAGRLGLEQAIDELAERLSLDPLALRDRIDPSPVRREERRIGAERIGWQRRHAAGRRSRARSSAGSAWRNRCGAPTCSSIPPARCACCATARSRCCRACRISAPGSARCWRRSSPKRWAAAEDITVRIGDTEFPAGPAVVRQPHDRLDHAAGAHRRLARSASCCARRAALNAGADDLVARDGRIFVRGDPSRGMRFRRGGRPAAHRPHQRGGFAQRRLRRVSPAHGRCRDGASRTWAACSSPRWRSIPRPGIIRVERVVAVQDCGRPMNPLQIESQVQGGVLMGLSYALFEERILDSTPAAWSIRIWSNTSSPAARDAEIEVVLLENYQGQQRDRCLRHRRAIANIATAPAIANAVYNAIGVRLRSLPMTPAAVLAALGKVPARS